MLPLHVLKTNERIFCHWGNKRCIVQDSCRHWPSHTQRQHSCVVIRCTSTLVLSVYYSSTDWWIEKFVQIILYKMVYEVLTEWHLNTLFAGLVKHCVRKTGSIPRNCPVLSEHGIKRIKRIWRRNCKTKGRSTVDITLMLTCFVEL